MKLRNFLFHRVSDEKDKLWPPMQGKLFEKIISFLKTNFLVVNLEDFLDDPLAFNSKNRKLATVLFDDGYKDNIEFAAPILKKYDCPASFYIVTNCIDKKIPTWTYLIDNAIQKTSREYIELPFEYVSPRLKSISLKVDGQHGSSIPLLKPWVKKLSNSRRSEIIKSILDQCKDVPLPENKMMSWDDIRSLKGNGFSIGSHSHTHPMLGSLENEGDIENELSTSADRIISEVGKKPAAISYPIGSFDNRVMKIAQEIGYKYGLAVEQKAYQHGIDNLFAIPRIELYQEPWWKVQLRLNGIYNRVKQLWT